MRNVKITETDITYTIDFCDKNLRVIESKELNYKFKKPFNFMNTEFEGETPEVMKFIYGMMKADYAAYKLSKEKYDFAEQHIEQLNNFDPLNRYTLDTEEMLIIKEKREIQKATGIIAELEDMFIKDRTIGNRDKIRKLLDYVKRYGATKTDIETLTYLIKPQKLF